MGLAGSARMYGRFVSGLPAFLRRRIDIRQAREAVRRQLDERDDSFLHLVRRSVFEHEGSPYRPLFRLAGCEFGDLVGRVRAGGTDAALRELREAGVYVTFDEFKGRTPIVRQGREFAVRSSDFDNPWLRHALEARTSGSTGPAARTPIDLDFTFDKALARALVLDAHGALGAPTAVWRGVLPGVAGLSNVLEGVLMGNVPERWFTPVTGADLRTPLVYRAATHGVLAAGRLCGVRMPRLEVVPLDDPRPILDWVERTLRREQRCLLRMFVSTAMRLCIAAAERGLDLRGAAVFAGGEPPTPAKVRRITGAGARWIPSYATTETSLVGLACANPVDENDHHVARHYLSLIQVERPVAGWDVTVGAFYVTLFLPAAPKVMINVETDDCGVLEPRACGCPFEALGLEQHVREIRSYRKLTGEGVTLVQSDVVRVLEEVLPARFGGTPLDYQLLEEEDASGFTRLTLLASPRVPLPDERVVVGAVLDALRETSVAASFAAAFWRQGGSLRLRREQPLLSAGGKFLPLTVARRLRPPAAP
ncbi:MAG: hypothetical protein KBD01_11935 [Acidobacteria bacterium]|nr:hypothetical protein [Acidobacteriota bacterium]